MNYLKPKKKSNIAKNEIEKYELQKSNLISKINSINEALDNTNIVKDAFNNNEFNKPLIDVIDHNNLQTEDAKFNDDQKEKLKSNKLDDEINKIFIQ